METQAAIISSLGLGEYTEFKRVIKINNILIQYLKKSKSAKICNEYEIKI